MVQLAVTEKIQHIQKEFEVRIRSMTADENGHHRRSKFENAHSCLSRIVEEIEPQVAEEDVSLGMLSRKVASKDNLEGM